MTFDDILAFYKTQRQIARVLGISEAAVANWKARGGIPALQQFRMYHLSKGVLKPSNIFNKGNKL